MNPKQFQFHAALVAAYTSLFASDPNYAFSASDMTATALADKMMAATLRGSANVTGPGFRLACKSCGIPHTGKAIDGFLGIAAPVKVAAATPKPRKVAVIGFSNIEAAISGVSRVSRAHDLVTLHYTDGKTESALVKSERWSEIHEKPFAIVGEVQSRRAPASIS